MLYVGRIESEILIIESQPLAETYVWEYVPAEFTLPPQGKL